MSSRLIHMNDKDYIILKEEMRYRLESFNAKLEEHARACGRQMSEITLVGVSKYFPPEYAKAAYELGLKNLGENRVQELVEKISVLSSLDIYPNWHLIGTLQKNKVKYILGKTCLIHSVDSLRLIDEIEKKSVEKDISTSILLQVNVSGEASKHGFNDEEVAQAIEQINNGKGIKVCGLMTMAPIDSSIALPGEVFESARYLFDRMRSHVLNPNDWRYLSMGMSQDYIEALQYGATHIRIGTSIFGSRHG